MLRAYFYFLNCQIKFLCPLLYLIFLKKIAQQAGRRPSSQMPLFLFYYFYFLLCLFFITSAIKKLNQRMHAPPKRFPGAPTPPDHPGAPAPQPPSRPVQCSNHQLRGKNIFLQLRLPPLHPFRPKGHVGKKRLAAGYTGTTDLFRGM